MKRGLFISLEGGEGLGKSTQAANVTAHLREEYESVVLTREPGGTWIGGKIREITHYEPSLAKEAELLLMAADRAQHVSELVRPALETGQIVLCDRYFDSTLAYQGGGRGWPVETLLWLHRIATDGLLPDITFVFQGTPHVEKDGDRFERSGDGFHERVARVYATMDGSVSWPNPERFRAVNANRPPEEITAELMRHIADFLAGRE